MNAGRPARSPRAERIARTMLGLALLAALMWALYDGGTRSMFGAG